MRDVLDKIEIEVPIQGTQIEVYIPDEYLCIPYGKDIIINKEEFKNDSNFNGSELPFQPSHLSGAKSDTTR